MKMPGSTYSMGTGSSIKACDKKIYLIQ